MAEEPNVPGQNEGRGEKATKRPQPVNLALVEAEERGIDLSVPPALPKPVAEPESPAPEAAGEAEAGPDQAGPEEAAPVNPPPAAEPIDPATASADLAALAEASTKGRLSPADEERATAIMRASLANGAEGIGEAFAAMGKLPWILGVRAIEQSWPSLPEDARALLLGRLAEERFGDFIRLRLSVARSLIKIDPEIGLRLAASVCRTIWMGEKGMLTPADSKLIGNVFIGRGKPWVLQLPLAGLSEEDGDAVVSCVAFSAFNVNNPPITQLSILRYGGDRLARLHPNLLGLIAKGVARWSPKWQASLQKEVAELPEAIASTMKQGRDAAPQQPARADQPDDAPAADNEQGEIPLPPELEEKMKLAMETGDHDTIVAVTAEVNTWREAQRTAAEEAAARAEKPEQSSRDRRGRRGRDKVRENEPERKERPAYVSREQEAAVRTGGAFNLSAALRQIESHVQQLRNELGNTQAKLRKAESSGRRATGSGGETGVTPEELKRLVLQLEQRNGELQARVEELLADSETRALATAADADITQQYRTLLKLKLQEEYADYLSLESGETDVIVQQHYRALIRQVFAILRAEGVALEGDLPPPPPPPMPPFPPPPDVDDEEEDDEELDRIEEPAVEEVPEYQIADESIEEPLDGELPDEQEQPVIEEQDGEPTEELQGEDGDTAIAEAEELDATVQPEEDERQK